MKKVLLPLLALALLAAVLYAAYRPAEQTLPLTAQGLRLELCDASGTVETVEILGDAAQGYCAYLPAYASEQTAQLVDASGERTALPAGGTVKLADGSALTIYAASPLPAVYLTTESGSLDAIRADKSHKESGAIRIVAADGSVLYDGDLTHIKGRGNTSWEFEKKPFNIKLAQAADLFGMGEARSWCLLANYRDRSFVRNAIVYDYAAAMDVENVTGTQSLDLYINGEYQGLYLLTEKVEIGENRLDLPDVEEENERANPQKKLSEYPAFHTGTKKGVSLPVTPDVCDGFVMELDFPDRWEEEASGFVTDAGQHVVIKYPEYASEQQVDAVSALVQEFETRLFSGDESYLDLIDLDSWVQLYLIEEIFEDVDCGLSSIYFYVENGRLVAGPLWDFDLTMGASYAVMNPETLYAAWSERTEEFISYYLPALYADETFRARVEELYAAQYSAALHELSAHAGEYVTAILSSAVMDAARWGRDAAETENAAEELQDYLARRADFLDRLWIAGERYHRVRLRSNVYTRYYEFMVREGETFDAFPSLYKEGYTLAGWLDEETDEPFDPTAPMEGERHLYALWEENAS